MAEPDIKATPRDAQRARVYRAETDQPSSPLPGLDACGAFADRVVGSLWWHLHFPAHDQAARPRLRPGNGARRAFYREEPSGATITLPRRYRTKGVILHELAHWGLGLDRALPVHGQTFTRLLLDLTTEFLGNDRAELLSHAFTEHRVRVGDAPRTGPDGVVRYGCDERLRLARGEIVTVHYGFDDRLTARFERASRGTLHFVAADGPRELRADAVWDVS